MNSYFKNLAFRLSLWLSFLALIFAFLLVVLWKVVVHTVPVGHAGVVWHRIVITGGAYSYGPVSEGLHIIFPWDKMYIYDLRLQAREKSYQVLSKDGLAFDVNLAFRWRIVKDNILILNQDYGTDYVRTLMEQEIGSVAREVVAHYSAEHLFTDARSEVQRAIYDQVTKASIHNGIGRDDLGLLDHSDPILLTDILIKQVELPVRIAKAIETKLEQAQVVEEYRFRVQRESLESERKRVEAEGIRSFQEIVTPGISESYLRWRGIEATLKLAQSPNSKVVVIGNSSTGLPLILDTKSEVGSAEIKSAEPPLPDETTSLDDDPRADQGTLPLIEPEIPFSMSRSN